MKRVSREDFTLGLSPDSNGIYTSGVSQDNGVTLAQCQMRGQLFHQDPHESRSISPACLTYQVHRHVLRSFYVSGLTWTS